MKKIALTILFLWTFLFYCSGTVIAIPVQWSVNGNYYDLILSSYGSLAPTWSAASAAAAGSTYAGVSGHLATITSAEENAFLFSLAPSIPDAWTQSGWAGAWLGGKEPEGWLVGPEAGNNFGYTNWNSTEPNNRGYAYMRIDASGLWYDDSIAGSAQGTPDSLSDPVIGYFVEYEANAPVPEPTTMLLLGSGLIGLASFRRRLRKK